jgi:hypothetical protein
MMRREPGRTAASAATAGANGGPLVMDKQRNTGILLIVLGAIFLFGQFVDVGRFAWPFFVIVPGVALLAWAFLGGRGAAGLAVPGSIVTTVGLILLVMNTTNTFEAWSYAWGLVIAGVGFGVFLHGALLHDTKRQRDGMRTVMTGLVLFAAFGIFFQYLIFGDMWGTWVGQWLLPLILIGGGVYMLAERNRTAP